MSQSRWKHCSMGAQKVPGQDSRPYPSRQHIILWSWNINRRVKREISRGSAHWAESGTSSPVKAQTDSHCGTTQERTISCSRLQHAVQPITRRSHPLATLVPSLTPRAAVSFQSTRSGKNKVREPALSLVLLVYQKIHTVPWRQNCRRVSANRKRKRKLFSHRCTTFINRGQFNPSWVTLSHSSAFNFDSLSVFSASSLHLLHISVLIASNFFKHFFFNIFPITEYVMSRDDFHSIHTDVFRE